MTARCMQTGATLGHGACLATQGGCWFCGTQEPGTGRPPPPRGAAGALTTSYQRTGGGRPWDSVPGGTSHPMTARAPDRHVGVASGDPGPALQDAAGNWWPHPLTADVPAHGGPGSHAPLTTSERGGQGRPSPTRRPRSARTVRVRGRGPGPYATFDHWHAATDGARVPDEPDEDKPKHRIGCWPRGSLAFLGVVLAVFLLTFVVGWLILHAGGVL